jgi:thiol-disulfide isomerase/thioredoxin
MSAITRIFGIYLFILFLIIACQESFGQVTVTHFNASWNKSNEVDWIMDLKDCDTKGYVDIAKNPEAQKEHKIAVIPTIIIFKDGEEVARFQADLSFKMVATREEVQEEIDEQLMSDF